MRDFLFVLLLATGVAFADDAPKVKRADDAAGAQEKSKEEAQASTKEDPNAREDSNLGMSILGNQEAPKALVIVPWKRSEIGTALGVSTMLRYYEIRSETTRHDGAPAAGRETAPTEGSAAQPATAAHRRKS
jgi:hypothetical protein